MGVEREGTERYQVLFATPPNTRFPGRRVLFGHGADEVQEFLAAAFSLVSLGCLAVKAASREPETLAERRSLFGRARPAVGELSAQDDISTRKCAQ